MAWILYADNNDDKLVSSEAGGNWKNEFGEPWVGVTWAPGWARGEHLPENDQVKGIKAGAYHKWKSIETIKQGRDNVRTWVGFFTPAMEEGKEDVQWVQRGIWGSLGYHAF